MNKVYVVIDNENDTKIIGVFLDESKAKYEKSLNKSYRYIEIFKLQ